MRRNIFVVSILAFVLGFGTDYALAVQTVRVGVYDNHPKIYQDTDGSIQGFWADITNYIAAQEDWNVVYVHDTWENNLARLEKGEIDLMVDVAVSDQRQAMYDFNDETALLAWGLFYTRDGLTLNSVGELQDKKIAVLKSGILYSGPLGLLDILSTAGVEAETIDVKEYDDVFQLLDSGEADVGVVNWFFGFANEDKYNVRRTNIMFQPASLRYALPMGAPLNAYLTNSIDTHLRQIKADPDSIYHQSVRKHFAGFVEQVSVLPDWAKYLLIALGVLFVLALVLVQVLRRYKKMLERQVAQNVAEIKFRNVVLSTEQEASIDGILVVDEGGNILNYNKRFADIWGLPPEILDTKSDERAIQYVTNKLEQPEEFLGKIRYLYNHHSEVSREEIQLKDGRVLDRYSAPMLDPNGGYFGRVWYLRDITESKEAMRRISEANEKVLQAERAKIEFVSIAAHQLQTPISAIQRYTELIKEGGTAEMQKHASDAIEKGVREMNELISFLLKITRAESGKLRLQFAPVDLKELTMSVVESLSSDLFAKSQRVVVSQIPLPFPTVVLDKEIVQQVILNLISNASRYSPEGSVIQVAMKTKDGMAVFAVTDLGMGIPEEAQGKIFEKFYRADNARSAVSEGTGLGLALAKSFVEVWGGKIWFESKENRGSTFTFTVPIEGTEKATAAPTS